MNDRATVLELRAKVVELETRREETIAMCAQLDAEKADLAAKLAGAMGALGDVSALLSELDSEKKCAMCARSPDGLICSIEGCLCYWQHRALADEPHASKRLRAIVDVMEARFKNKCPYGVSEGALKTGSVGCCDTCKDRVACKAVRGEGE